MLDFMFEEGKRTRIEYNRPSIVFLTDGDSGRELSEGNSGLLPSRVAIVEWNLRSFSSYIRAKTNKCIPTASHTQNSCSTASR